jgi:hypothetical protein
MEIYRRPVHGGVSTSETSANFYQTTRCNITEDRHLAVIFGLSNNTFSFYIIRCVVREQCIVEGVKSMYGVQNRTSDLQNERRIANISTVSFGI